MPRFRYCLNASTIRTTPVLQQIKTARAAGYDAIELWHDHLDRHLQQGGTLAEVRQALSDHGLTVPTTIQLAGWFQPAGPAHHQALDEVRRRLEQSAAVGATHAIAGPPRGTANRTLGAAHYHELLEIGKTFGVQPAFEYLGFAADICRLEDAIDIVNRTQHRDATIVIDPFHCVRGGGSIDTIQQLAPQQIAISHFNDCPPNPPFHQQSDSDRVMPGDGVVDLDTWCRTLTDIGYNGWLSLELFREDLLNRNPLQVAREGLEKMQRIAEA